MHKDIIRYKGQYYIRANSSIADSPTRVLKYGDTFAILNQYGDIRPFGLEDHGLFHEGTRFLSRYDLDLNDKSPLLLSSNIKKYTNTLVVGLTNPDFETEDGIFIERGVIHLIRTIFLLDGGLYEELKVQNYGLGKVCFNLTYEFSADFVDIFELRGISRPKRGELLDEVVNKKSVTLRYKGLDDRTRNTRIDFSERPVNLGPGHAQFIVELAPHDEVILEIRIGCQSEKDNGKFVSLAEAFKRKEEYFAGLQKDICRIETSNEQFNDWINQSRSDLFMLLTKTPYGFYPYAGIPWFSTIFGRDGIITALETLWLYPFIAKGVLTYLANSQAEACIPAQDAEPGKILHEERKGEMAALGEIPFGHYYGTIDATPLFIILAGYYYERTGDLAFVKSLWPHVERALFWIDNYGDLDGDGFVEYRRKAKNGLGNQGWKDSDDSVFHQDGDLAAAPIALCEVQGYVYEAKLKAARLASVLGKKQRSSELRKEAETLKKKFMRIYWCGDKKVYALALDGNKNPCLVKSSNAGHCLFTGIAGEEHARQMVDALLKKDMFTGWGIRTLSSEETRYNPMSYHNGTIWPHDNALIAYGMSRYGYKNEVSKILTGLFDASIFMDLNRLPELFCGFERRSGEYPILYPVACSPQAWATGVVFMLIQACLGLSFNAKENKIVFDNPVLPEFLDYVYITNLKIKDAAVDVSLQRHKNDVGINIERKTGDVDIIVIK